MATTLLVSDSKSRLTFLVELEMDDEKNILDFYLHLLASVDIEADITRYLPSFLILVLLIFPYYHKNFHISPEL